MPVLLFLCPLPFVHVDVKSLSLKLHIGDFSQIPMLTSLTISNNYGLEVEHLKV